MTDSPKSMGSRAPKLRRTVRAIRSGIRRYPRAILDSMSRSAGCDEPLYLPELLHELVAHALAVVWLGHGSVAAQIGDVSVVVDPVLSERIGVRIGRRTIGVRRLRPAVVSAESLRGTDVVLITHAHFDHLDKPTLERMGSEKTTVITPRRCAKLIPSGFGRVVELAAGSSMEIHGLTISAMEPRHWGARSIFDRRRGVNSYVVESKDQRVLFAGDTAETDCFDGVGVSGADGCGVGGGGIDLAVMGIGAYDPWDHMHATPEQAWGMFRAMDARFLLPIHHSTFELSDEPIDEPMRRLLEIAGADSGLIIDPVVGEVVVMKGAGFGGFLGGVGGVGGVGGCVGVGVCVCGDEKTPWIGA